MKMYAGADGTPVCSNGWTRGLFRFRVFPIEPGERKRVQVRYVRWLQSHDGYIEYRALLTDPNAHISAETSGLASLPQLSSPTHELLVRPSDSDVVSVRVTPKRRGNELILRWEAASSDWRVLAHAHSTADESGFVNIVLAAPPRTDANTTGRDITLLLDRSGSMAGSAFRRSKDAALEILESGPGRAHQGSRKSPRPGGPRQRRCPGDCRLPRRVLRRASGVPDEPGASGSPGDPGGGRPSGSVPGRIGGLHHGSDRTHRRRAQYSLILRRVLSMAFRRSVVVG